MDLKDKIRSIEDYPQKGVIFRDITTLLKDAEGLKDAVDAITASLADVSFDLVLSPESRGFIFGKPSARNMSWNTARQQSKFIRMPSSPDRRLSL